MIGAELNFAMNLVGLAERGFLPSAGGTLDQSQWFLNLFSRMQTEIATIQEEDAEKAKSKYRSNRRRR